jgi:hypothetical protein
MFNNTVFQPRGFLPRPPRDAYLQGHHMHVVHAPNGMHRKFIAFEFLDAACGRYGINIVFCCLRPLEIIAQV